jgi:PAS domain S-box-containing protein
MTARAVDRVRRYSALAAVALAIVAAAELAIYIRHRASAERSQRSRVASTLARQAEALAVDRESGIRGFLLTRDSSTLEPATAAAALLPGTLNDLRQATADEPDQSARAADATAAYIRWDSLYASPALRGAKPDVRLAGKPLFDHVRRSFESFILAQDELAAERARRDDWWSLVALLVVLLPLPSMAVIFAILGARVAEQAAVMGAQRRRMDEEADVRARTVAQLDAALEGAPLGIAFFDPDLRFTRANSTLSQMVGRPQRELVDLPITEILPEPLRESVVTSLERVLSSGEAETDLRVTVAEPRDGAKRQDFLVNHFPVFDAAGAVTGVGAVLLDITEREEMAAQMRQSQKMEAVGRLAGGVAHDFNNLLTVIRSYCDLVLLEIGGDDPKRDELLEIRDAADRAASLTRQLLAFSRKQVLLPKLIDVNRVVSSLDRMLGRLLPPEVKRETRLDPAVGRIMADTGSLEQVVMNLVLNAADAMPDGGTVTVETANTALDEEYARHHSEVEPGDYVMIAVSDTGTGMDAATMERCFEPFFTTKGDGKGTGLGLSTVYGIVRQLKGHLWVYSEIGLGTTFKLYFPLQIGGVTTPAGGVPVPTFDVSAGLGQTVLIVEDEPAVRLTITRVLERQGFRVLQAAHGGEAMRLAAEFEGTIDLVVSDLMMPEMSGREFVDRFSATHGESRVLFMSGYSDGDLQHRGLLDAHHTFIEKPFTVDQLTRKVHDLLSAV